MTGPRLCAFALLAACGAVLAAPHDAVLVTAVRDPVAKSYRKMVEGLELFERRRHLAPAASLRFRLLPRKHATAMEGVELEVAADSLAIPLKVAQDRTFTIERDPVAIREDAKTIPPASSAGWRS